MKIILFAAITMVIMVSACSPKVGSDAWCASMKEKPNDEWTSVEVKEYAKNCIFK